MRVDKEKQKKWNIEKASELFFNNEEDVYNSALNDDDCFNELVRVEESLMSLMEESKESYFLDVENGSLNLQEELDLTKAEKEITPSKKMPLPLYLKNYMEADRNVKPADDKIIVKFGLSGLKLLGSFFENSVLSPVMESVPAVRTGAHQPVQSLFMMEQGDNGNIMYQIIQENEDEAYLSMKFDSSYASVYNQVNLKKDNRFIYSTNINSEGQVSFSGLKEGIYNIELMGKNTSKRFDLSLFTDKM